MSALRVARLLSGLEAKLFQIGGQTNPFGGQTSLFPNFRQFLERFIYLPKSDIIGLLDISEKKIPFGNICAYVMPWPSWQWVGAVVAGRQINCVNSCTVSCSLAPVANDVYQPSGKRTAFG